MRNFFALILLLIAAPLFSQASEIAVIDVQKVVYNSEVGKKALAEVKAMRDKKQQEMDQKQNAIQTMQDKFEKEKDILSPDAQEKRRAEIQKSITELRRFKEDSEQEVQSKLASALKGMEEKVLPIIQKLGNERGFSIIISRDQLIYYNAKIDITDEVIRLFNEQSAAPEKKQ